MISQDKRKLITLKLPLMTLTNKLFKNLLLKDKLVDKRVTLRLLIPLSFLWKNIWNRRERQMLNCCKRLVALLLLSVKLLQIQLAL